MGSHSSDPNGHGVKHKHNIKRREFLASVAAVPLLSSSNGYEEKSRAVKDAPARLSDPVRLGIIGYGKRGEELVSNLTPSAGLNDLSIEIRGISEVNEQRLEHALLAAGPEAKAYKHYQDLLNSEDIDAVIIAAPDHWHARMAMDAASHGIHIYLEKCMTRTVEEAKSLRDAVRKSGVVFQLGHQGRQRDLNLKARELIANQTLGELTLIETTTNRNDPRDGWTSDGNLHVDANTVDWELFQGPAGDKYPFSPARYHGWRNYWDYGSGMSGDLLSNEFDAVNTILDLGIPDSAIASGGLYFHKDGREVPDVFQAAFEYPHRSLSLLYSGTLASGVPRGMLFMGNDATLELGRILSVWVDKHSTKYKSRIKAGMIDPSAPFINYERDQSSVDAISSATSKYYADRGLTSTFREGSQISTTYLHLAEWLNCIRNGGNTSCHIERGFEEAITAHMATQSYREGRKVNWDPGSETII